MDDTDKSIWVKQPFLPPLDEFVKSLEKIWESKWITNSGAFHFEFEDRLKEYLGVEHLSLFCNGTLALISALQALRISGEVITTPFSFVASTHALHWNNIKPVFVDIEPDACTLDPLKVEAAITPNTTAILPVHVYGNPCRVEALQNIADTYGLKIIYDAAHAFGVKMNGNSILNFGDLSVLSFHATKSFNTIEGGAVICHDEIMKKRLDFLKNFGFADETTVIAPGINAKLNELQAAYGLLLLKHIDQQREKALALTELYRQRLEPIKGISLLREEESTEYNYSFMPVFVNQSEYGRSRDELYEILKAHQIFGRRYFYPLISDFPTYRGLPSATEENLLTAKRCSDQVICLPLYAELDPSYVEKVCKIINARDPSM